MLAVFLFSLSEIAILAGDVIHAVRQLYDCSGGIIQGQFYACVSACLCCTCSVSFACFESRKQSLIVLNLNAFPLFALGFKCLILCCGLLLCVHSFFLDIVTVLWVLCIIALKVIDVVILVRVIIMNFVPVQRTVY